MSVFARAALALVVLGALALPAQAQYGAGRSPGGGNAGDVGGGASGAANRGGAGGVANPEPGGFRPDGGEPRESAGPNSQTGRRAGYLGGRTPADDGSGGTGSTVQMPAGASDAYCHDVSPAGMTPSARLSAPNVERLDLAGSAMGAAPGESARRYLLANLQDELSRPAPDLQLAAAYVGIAASGPVTPEMVQRVSELLCVPLQGDQARRLSAIAEAQRLRGGAMVR